jgi:hypothetical protein
MPTLTDLPVELVEDIFEDVHSSNREARKLDSSQPRHLNVGLACKHLLPIWRHIAYRTLVMRSWYSLLCFCEAVYSDAEVGSVVHSLEIDYRESGLRDRGDPPARLVYRLFEELPSLTHLTISEAPRIAELFLLPSRDSSPLPRLQHITFHDTFSLNSGNPFDPRDYVHLDAYPLLEALTIHDEFHTLEPEELYEPFRHRLPSRKKRWSIALLGPVGRNPALSDFLALFSHIDPLILDEPKLPEPTPTDDNYPDQREYYRPLLPALQALEHPESLTSLVLKDPNYSIALEDLATYLPLFPMLCSIEVSGSVKLTSLLPVLSSLLHLHSIVLHGLHPYLAHLRALFEGPTKVPALKTLYSDVVWAEQESDTEARVQELVEDGKARGVEVGGELRFISFFL